MGRAFVIGAGLVIAIGACVPYEISAARELHAEARVLDLPPSFYYGVAWVEPDVLALAVDDPDSSGRLAITSPSADTIRSFQVPARPECARRTLVGLGRLPTGDIGAADICTLVMTDPPQTATLIAVDPVSLDYQDLGPAGDIPSWLTWRNDMSSAVYAVGDGLCSVLYEQGERDGPLDMTVTAQGREFPVGVDLSADEDGCPDDGLASFPAYARDDRLAFVAAATSGREGQDRLDLPWALLVRPLNDEPVQILDGIGQPRGLI